MCVTRHNEISQSVWTCLQLCLILLPDDDLHLIQGVLSLKLLQFFVFVWKAFLFAVCKQNLSPQCFTSSALVKLFANRRPGGTHTVTLFIYLHVHTHTHLHNVTQSPHLCHWPYKHGKASTVCFLFLLSVKIPQLELRAHTAGAQVQQSLMSSFTALTSVQK